MNTVPKIREAFADTARHQDENENERDLFTIGADSLSQINQAALSGFVTGNAAVTAQSLSLPFHQATQKDKNDRDTSARELLIRMAAQKAAEKAIEDINRRLHELKELAERYGRNIEAQNQINLMLQRKENPFLKDAQGNYVYKDLLLDEETGAGLTIQEVQALEKMKSPEEQSAALRKKTESVEVAKRSAEETARDLEVLRDAYQDTNSRIPNDQLRALGKEASIQSDVYQIEDLDKIQESLYARREIKIIEIETDLIEDLSAPDTEASNTLTQQSLRAQSMVPQ